MKNKLLIWGFIFSVAVNVAVLSTIGFHWWGGYGRQGHREILRHRQKSFLSRELEFSESQTEQMEPLKKSLQADMQDIRGLLHEKRAELVNLLVGPKPDRETVNVKLNEIASLQADLQKLTIDYLLKQKALLSPKQQEKFGSMIKKRFYREVGHHESGGFSGWWRKGNRSE